ncbi:viral late transcription elongation factor [Brazilian porcupinepox virus 1]|nr:viral late transcription elongation factor [Brazilian porcupinepox virus 1]
MPFRDLILFHLSNFLLTENVYSIKMAISICRCFGIDVKDMILNSFDKRYLNKALNLLVEYDEILPEINISLPENTIYELIRLRLYKFSKYVKTSYKLTKMMKGIVIIKDIYVYIHRANDELLDFIFKEYNPKVYIYIVNKPDNINGSKIILCGYDKITFFAYSIANITSNQETSVIVTDNCIKSLSDPINKQILFNLFDNTNSRINKILRNIFYSFFVGGQTS